MESSNQQGAPRDGAPRTNGVARTREEHLQRATAAATQRDEHAARPSVAASKRAQGRPSVKPTRRAKGEALASSNPDATSDKPTSTDRVRTRPRVGAQAASEDEAPRKRSKGRIVATVLVSLVFVVFVCVAGALSFYRFFYGDDVTDIQGTWYIAGTTTPITITEDSIVLNDEVSYRYVINPDAKTVVFTFGRLKGEGHYRFSLDRQQLAIMDGSFGWWDTFFDDAGWVVGALVDSIQGTQKSPAGPTDVTLLVKDGTLAKESQAQSDAGALNRAADAANTTGGDGASGGEPGAAGSEDAASNSNASDNSHA